MSDAEFGTVLGMSKDAFRKLKDWRKSTIKKEKSLF
jgi:hypothetical protein